MEQTPTQEMKNILMKDPDFAEAYAEASIVENATVGLKKRRESVELTVQEMEDIYNSMIEDLPIAKADALFQRYSDAIVNLRGEPMGEEDLRVFMMELNSISYELTKHLSRQGLRSDIVNIHAETRKAESFIDVRTREGKYIREEKDAIASMETAVERQLDAIYKRTVQALESRIRVINNTSNTVNMMASLLMSSRKMGANV